MAKRKAGSAKKRLGKKDMKRTKGGLSLTLNRTLGCTTDTQMCGALGGGASSANTCACTVSSAYCIKQ